MKATILSETRLPDLPSASGIEIIGPTAYVIGDDSPLLYLLDAATLAPLARITLFETKEFGGGRIPKASKPDLEALLALTWPDGRAGVLALGSGSTPAREVGWFVPVSGAAPHKVSLAGLYALLRRLLPAGETLNLEAAAATDKDILLFQRAIGAVQAGQGLVNRVFMLPVLEVLRFLSGQSSTLPAPRVQQLPLPLLAGKPAGFSGATFAEGRLFVSASVEDTQDAVLDGEVLGSFVGFVDLDKQAAQLAHLTWADGRVYKGKVEGLAVRRQLAPGHWELLLVTDDDAGGSTAAIAELKL
ncbi:hypothetical protein GCM10023185_00810 [Hymenobacter saemangeumensis]|uniref:Uncharacterized protein n=1 Tax=Hymenobacter saemangeumensis TaxID=1084522 RepID=A0ABP8HX27_9BACT